MNYDIVIFYRPATGEEALLECLRQVHEHFAGFDNVYVVGPGPDYRKGGAPVHFEFPFDTPAIWITRPSFENYFHYRSALDIVADESALVCGGSLGGVLQYQLSQFIPGLAENCVVLPAEVQFSGTGE